MENMHAATDRAAIYRTDNSAAILWAATDPAPASQWAGREISRSVTTDARTDEQNRRTIKAAAVY